MSSETSLDSREAFATHFETLQLDGEIDEISRDETIVPNSMYAFRDDVEALQTLPRLAVRAPGKDATHPDLEVIGTLGEGGMGLVRLAEQVSLKRNVAVKTLRNANHQLAAQSLLKEAYVTGHLEHPNVVPIYTLGQGDEGAPLIVMKRIEGDSWQDRLAHEHASCEFDLDRNIEILLQVCNAVRFAHSRQILHRDIKPENVMIGAYDEVYLLDWGIAITTSDEPGLLPRQEDSVGVAGTPSYMAPEMTNDTAVDLDERTDVYLLGATLHHVLTGRPRHDGKSLFDVMFAASKSSPFEYGSDVPRPLAEIANRACSARKEDRYRSAAEFRGAIHDWMEHKGSIEVAAEAERARAEFEALLELERSPETELKIHDLIGECRFGYRQALRMWPENTAARAGQRAFFEGLFEFHLEQEQPIAARAMLGELGDEAGDGDDGDDRAVRLEALEGRLAEAREKVDKLEKMAASLDLRTAARSRSRLALLLGILWTISTCYTAWRAGTTEPTNADLLVKNLYALLRSVVIVATGIFIFRKRIFANVANRRIIAVLLSTLGSMAILRLMFWLAGGDYVLAQGAEIVLYGFSLLVVGLISDLRICYLSAFFFIAAGLGVVYPEYQLWILAPSNLLVFSGVSWMWSPRQMDKRITIADA